jgi:metal-sulfur cluster biosynthetic enzyme
MSDLREQVIVAIQTVIDPDLGINIYDMGLIYKIDFDNDNNCAIVMTLTSPGCPSGTYLIDSVMFAIHEIKEVKETTVRLTFTPQWSPDCIEESMKYELGLL